MFYISITLFAIAVLFTIYPPTFTVRYIYGEPTLPTTPVEDPEPQAQMTQEELEKIYKDNKQPNYDDLVKAMNETLHDIAEEGTNG